MDAALLGLRLAVRCSLFLVVSCPGRAVSCRVVSRVSTKGSPFSHSKISLLLDHAGFAASLPLLELPVLCLPKRSEVPGLCLR